MERARVSVLVMLIGGVTMTFLPTSDCRAAVQSSSPEHCSRDAIATLAGESAVVQSATWDVTPVAHCKVEGYATSPMGNRSHFRLQLPDAWAGRYYFIGLGGAAGYVPTESQIPNGNPMVKGFAVAGTDTGHQGSPGDYSFMGRSREEAIDNTARGAHLVAVATQAITRGYYGANTVYRYHSGCSGGGRMGMEAMTRHPEDYDGLLIGGPVATIGPNYTMAAFIHMAQQLSREEGAWLSPEKLALADARVTRRCDALDGAADGVVSEPGLCKVDFRSELACDPAGDTTQCLTGPEIATIEALLAGPSGLKPGWPISNMSTWSMYVGLAPPPWPRQITAENARNVPMGFLLGDSMMRTLFGPDFDSLRDMRFDDREILTKQMEQMVEATAATGFSGVYSPDLRGFQKAGGKAIIWSGISDPSALHVDAVEYYELAGERIGGGTEALLEFTRLYPVPGMGHCGGGTGPHDAPDRLLDSLIAWVEQGEAPDRVVVHRGATAELAFRSLPGASRSGVAIPAAAGDTRDFLLCPYPQKPVFDGTEGGEFDAKHWSCGATAAPPR